MTRIRNVVNRKRQEKVVGELTGIGITRETRIPLNIGAVSVSARSDSVQADGAEDARVGQLWAGGDDTVGDGVVDGLFLM